MGIENSWENRVAPIQSMTPEESQMYELIQDVQVRFVESQRQMVAIEFSITGIKFELYLIPDKLGLNLNSFNEFDSGMIESFMMDDSSAIATEDKNAFFEKWGSVLAKKINREIKLKKQFAKDREEAEKQDENQYRKDEMEANGKTLRSLLG